MRLTPTQELHLRNLKTANDAWRTAKRDSFARAKIIAAEEVSGYLNAMDHQVRLAYESGVPKLQLRRDGMGTLDSKTLEDSLRRTAAAFEAMATKFETDPLAGRYSLAEDDSTLLTTTLDGVALETACADADWSVADAIGAGVTTAEFRVQQRDDSSKFLAAVTPSFLPEHGNVHPVVQWARQPENEAEALAWVREKVAA